MTVDEPIDQEVKTTTCWLILLCCYLFDGNLTDCPKKEGDDEKSRISDIVEKVEQFMAQYKSLVPWKMIKNFHPTYFSAAQKQELYKTIYSHVNSKNRKAPPNGRTKNTLCVTDAGAHGKCINIAGITVIPNSVRMFIGAYTIDEAAARKWCNNSLLFEIAGSYIHLIISAILYPGETFTVGLDQQHFIEKINDISTPISWGEDMDDILLLHYLHQQLKLTKFVQSYEHQKSDSPDFIEHRLVNAVVTFSHYKDDPFCNEDLLNAIKERKLGKDELSARISFLTVIRTGLDRVFTQNQTPCTVFFETSIQRIGGNQIQKSSCLKKNIKTNPENGQLSPGEKVCIKIDENAKDNNNLRLVVKSWLSEKDQVRKQQLEGNRGSIATHTLFLKLDKIS